MPGGRGHRGVGRGVHAHHHHGHIGNRHRHHHGGGGRPARLLSPEWAAYNQACIDYAQKIPYPAAFRTFRFVSLLFALLQLISSIVALAAPVWVIHNAHPLAQAVLSGWYISSSYAGDTVSIAAGGINCCAEGGGSSFFCTITVGILDIGGYSFYPAVAGMIAMCALTLVVSVVGMFTFLLCSWSIQSCASYDSVAGPNADIWKLKWMRNVQIISGVMFFFRTLSLIITTTALVEQFVSAYPSLTSRKAMAAGAGLVFMAIGLVLDIAHIIFMNYCKGFMRKHAATVELPPLPPAPTGPRYLDEVIMLQAAGQLQSMGSPAPVMAPGMPGAMLALGLSLAQHQAAGAAQQGAVPSYQYPAVGGFPQPGGPAAYPPPANTISFGMPGNPNPVPPATYPAQPIPAAVYPPTMSTDDPTVVSMNPAPPGPTAPPAATAPGSELPPLPAPVNGFGKDAGYML